MDSSSIYLYLQSQGLECYRIFLKNFEIPVSIGIHSFEKQKRQSLRINVELWFRKKTFTDHISAVVDYDFIRTEIRNLVEKQHYELQETFCEAILDRCHRRGSVIFVRVSTQKTNVYEDCEAVGCEMFRVFEENFSQDSRIK